MWLNNCSGSLRGAPWSLSNTVRTFGMRAGPSLERAFLPSAESVAKAIGARLGAPVAG